MDLMGSDAVQSEDDMRRMWGDSIKTGKGQHARITYDDFLLLMKGQTKEPPLHESNLELTSSAAALVGTTRLHVVPESDIACETSSTKSEEDSTIKVTSGDMITADGTIVPAAKPAVGLDDSNHSPLGVSLLQPSQSAPNTPEDHRRTLNLEMRIDSPLAKDEEDDHIVSSGPGVPGSSASLTPPMSPSRGIQDYCTPSAQRRSFVEFKDMKSSNLDLPGLSSILPSGALVKPPIYTRGRSRSMGDDHDTPEKTSVKDIDEANKLSAVAEVAEAVHDLILPETNHTHVNVEIDQIVHDQSKSNLLVNRKLYRAHRQMRMAVLEASKRFEEQQTEHAKEILLAARDEDDGHGMIQAGLVMRHGIKKQVSSKAIRTLLEQNHMQQQVLVEKANRRGGRGRRSRKKTISDMSGMLSSIGADDFGAIALKASLEQSIPEDTAKIDEDVSMYEDISPEPEAEESGESVPGLPDLAAEGPLRAATVPGEFRKTSDPFGKQGRYGALASWKS